MRLSISFLLVIFSCYLALTFSQFTSSGPCTKPRKCYKHQTPYCVKNADGTIEQKFLGCPPCGPGVSSYTGYCPNYVRTYKGVY